MLYVDLKVNEVLQIGDVTIALIQKSGQLARLSVEADKSKEIKKVSVINALQKSKNVIIHSD